MENIIELLVADNWGSNSSLAGMSLVIVVAVHQAIKVSIKSAVATILAGMVLINGLLAIGARLV
jgi:hypothetical protein